MGVFRDSRSSSNYHRHHPHEQRWTAARGDERKASWSLRCVKEWDEQQKAHSKAHSKNRHVYGIEFLVLFLIMIEQRL